MKDNGDMQNTNISSYLLFLRVFASHLVVVGHAASYFGVLKFTQWPQAPYFQSTSVIIFFFLSGFTIAWLCDQRKGTAGYSFEKFAFDRFCRITIPLVPVLVACAIFEYLVYQPHPNSNYFNTSTFLSNVLMLQGFPTMEIPPGPFGTNAVLWTLAAEHLLDPVTFE